MCAIFSISIINMIIIACYRKYTSQVYTDIHEVVDFDRGRSHFDRACVI